MSLHFWCQIWGGTLHHTPTTHPTPCPGYEYLSWRTSDLRWIILPLLLQKWKFSENSISWKIYFESPPWGTLLYQLLRSRNNGRNLNFRITWGIMMAGSASQIEFQQNWRLYAWYMLKIPYLMCVWYLLYLATLFLSVTNLFVHVHVSIQLVRMFSWST